MSRCLAAFTNDSCMAFNSSTGSMVLFVVYVASMLPTWPIKNTRKSCAMRPLDSAIKSCVSKYARKTYGLHENLGLKTLCILRCRQDIETVQKDKSAETK